MSLRRALPASPAAVALSLALHAAALAGALALVRQEPARPLPMVPVALVFAEPSKSGGADPSATAAPEDAASQAVEIAENPASALPAATRPKPEPAASEPTLAPPPAVVAAASPPDPPKKTAPPPAPAESVAAAIIPPPPPPPKPRVAPRLRAPAPPPPVPPKPIADAGKASPESAEPPPPAETAAVDRPRPMAEPAPEPVTPEPAPRLRVAAVSAVGDAGKTVGDAEKKAEKTTDAPPRETPATETAAGAAALVPDLAPGKRPPGAVSARLVPTAASDGPGGIEGGERDAPTPLSGNPRPRYPFAARRKGIEGRVVLRVTVLASGRVEDLAVERTSGSRLLDRAALEAVRRWRFAPATRLGRPVAATVRVPIAFRLDR